MSPSNCSGTAGSPFSLEAATLKPWFYTNVRRSLLRRSQAHVYAHRISEKAAQRALLPFAEILHFISIVLWLLTISLDKQIFLPLSLPLPVSLSLSVRMRSGPCKQAAVSRSRWRHGGKWQLAVNSIFVRAIPLMWGVLLLFGRVRPITERPGGRGAFAF